MIVSKCYLLKIFSRHTVKGSCVFLARVGKKGRDRGCQGGHERENCMSKALAIYRGSFHPRQSVDAAACHEMILDVDRGDLDSSESMKRDIASCAISTGLVHDV